MKTVHLVVLNPHEPRVEGMRRLLKWDRTRGVPDLDLDDNHAPRSRALYVEGMLCEIDDEDLAEARTFCDVEVLGTKEVAT